MLQVSAVDLEWQTGKPNSFSSVKYTRESTRLLRDRLQHPVQGISNETIGAVATLAALEVNLYSLTFPLLLLTPSVRMEKYDGHEDAYSRLERDDCP